MKKFKFKLQSLLKIKNQEEDIKKEKLTIQIKKLREIENNIDYLIKEIESYTGIYNTTSESGLVLWNFSNYKDYLMNLNTKLVDEKRKKTDQAKLVKELQVEYLKLKRTVDSLAKIKEMKFQQYLTESQKAEYMVMDELAITKHFRQEDKND
jgi:flagellar FliJ protein